MHPHFYCRVFFTTSTFSLSLALELSRSPEILWLNFWFLTGVRDRIWGKNYCGILWMSPPIFCLPALLLFRGWAANPWATGEWVDLPQALPLNQHFFSAFCDLLSMIRCLSAFQIPEFCWHLLLTVFSSPFVFIHMICAFLVCSCNLMRLQRKER